MRVRWGEGKHGGVYGGLQPETAARAAGCPGGGAQKGCECMWNCGWVNALVCDDFSSRNGCSGTGLRMGGLHVDVWVGVGVGGPGMCAQSVHGIWSLINNQKWLRSNIQPHSWVFAHCVSNMDACMHTRSCMHD